MAHWRTVSGIVVEGFRVASGSAVDSPYPEGTIVMQTPFFRVLGLDLAPFHPATIGVSCRPFTFVVKNPEFSFRGVKWSPEHETEDFSFSRCRITVGGEERDGLVYYPHPDTKLGHFHDDSTLEILAPFMDGVYYGAEVRLDINTDEIDIVKDKP